MDDLISRAAAIKGIGKLIREYREKGEDATADGLILSRRYVVKTLPAVDAVPVVRCRDCRYWGTPFDKNDTGFMVAHCEHFDESHAFSEQFYCASGERRDSNGTNA